MKLEVLFDANKVATELRQWQDIDTRLSCGDGFYNIMFNAYETKSMQGKYEKLIRDESTINAFKKFVKSMIKKCEDEIERL